MARYFLPSWAGRFAKIVSLNPASVAASAGATTTFTAIQTFASTTYPELTGLKKNKFTFAQFKTTPVDAAIHVVSAACYTDGTLTLIFANNTATPVNLDAADFIIMQL
jgi:hypothetical protein